MNQNKPHFKKDGKSPAGGPGGPRMKRRMGPPKKKVCRFCADKMEIDYKNLALLRTFITERGKMLSGRITGTCSGHQRELTRAIKRARMLAFLPFTVI
jgi:small subunit ribosomal protein S18